MITNKSFTIRAGHTRVWPMKIAIHSWFDYHIASRFKAFAEDLFNDKFFQARGISLSHVVANGGSSSISVEVFVHDSKLYDFYNSYPAYKVFRFGLKKKRKVRSRLYLKKKRKVKKLPYSKRVKRKLFTFNRKKFLFFSSKHNIHKKYRIRSSKNFLRRRYVKAKFTAFGIRQRLKRATRGINNFSKRLKHSVFFRRRFKTFSSISKFIKKLVKRTFKRRVVRRPRFFFIKKSPSYSPSSNISRFYRYIIFRSFSKQVRGDRKKRFKKKRKFKHAKRPSRPYRKRIKPVSPYARFSNYFARSPYKSAVTFDTKRPVKVIKKTKSVRRSKRKSFVSNKSFYKNKNFRNRRRFRGSPLLPLQKRAARFMFFNQYSAYASYRFVRYRFYHFIGKFIASQLYAFFKVPVSVNFSFFPIHRGTSSFYLNFITTKLYYRYILSDVVKPIVRMSLRFYRGFVIHCKGRFTRAQMAVTKKFVRRSVSYSKVNSLLDYAQRSVVLKYGTCNLRIWIRHLFVCLKHYLRL